MWFFKRNGQDEGEFKEEKWEILERLKMGEWLPPGVYPSNIRTYGRRSSRKKLLMIPVAAAGLLIALAVWLPFHISQDGQGHKSGPPPGKVATDNGSNRAPAGSQAASSSAKPGSGQSSSNPSAGSSNAPSSAANNVATTAGGVTAAQPASGSTSGAAAQSSPSTSPVASIAVPTIAVGLLGQPLLATPPIGLQL